MSAEPPIAPRLLTSAEARAYCGGVSPKAYANPHRTPYGLRFDRREIDAALDRRAGLTNASVQDDADAALQGWQARHGAA